jgi:hypothetical protein
MPLTHSLVTNDDDFYNFTPFMFSAIRPNGFVDACWPANTTPERHAFHAKGFIAHKNWNPSVVWSKVTDTDTGAIIG